MNASSESGLCALTISWGVTEVITGLASYSVQHVTLLPREMKGQIKMERAALRLACKLRSIRWRSSECASRALPLNRGAFGQSDRPVLRYYVLAHHEKPPSS